MTRRPDGEASSREAGLRWLAQSTASPELNLQQVLQQPHDPSKSPRRMAAMRALIDGVSASMPNEISFEQQAKAFWRLIQDEIARIGQPEGNRRRAALEAALHLDPNNTAPSVDKRLIFARDEGKFGSKPSGGHHGYDALRMWWGWGVRILGHAVDERLDYLASEPAEWRLYLRARDSYGETYRLPSQGAQPFFVDLFVTSVFMRKKSVYRRITERIVTARKSGVAYYTARGYSAVGAQLQRTYVPVQPLFGCTAEHIFADDEAEPPVTRLRFPHALDEGQQAHFASETLFGDSEFDRRWINVDIDHHGIAPGETSYDGKLPAAGLTIRIRFDETCLPSAVWWYAEVPERERYRRPLPSDAHLLDIVGLDVQKTFVGACQPRESYGIAFTW